MISNLTLQEFLTSNRISEEIWANAKIEWPLLLAIAADHEAHLESLGDAAKYYAAAIQKINKVHSVRWRVKDVEHLLEKIVRKRAEGVDKYLSISVDNYYECVTDLVGVRALHLFKEDCLEIDITIRDSWRLIENPVAYVRSGDSDSLITLFRDKGFEVKTHPAGYRSVHYILESQPNKRKLITEVQVRTIFEEGWSEIDHKIRYPNFSDNEIVNYFLAIFNRLAGNADEMGGFVLGLVANITDLEARVKEATKEKEDTLRDMEQTLNQLESVEKKNSDSAEIIAKLRNEVDKLKEAKSVGITLQATGGPLIGDISDLKSKATTLELNTFRGLFDIDKNFANILKSNLLNADKDLREVLNNHGLLSVNGNITVRSKDKLITPDTNLNQESDESNTSDPDTKK